VHQRLDTRANGAPRTLLYSKTFCWITRRRGLLTVLLGLIALCDALWGEARPISFLGRNASLWALLPLSLTLAAVVIRIWGAGNLRKNKEVTRTGIYRMVRHPLYLGNSLVYLAFFLSFGNPVLGILLFLILIYPIHYPLMLQEEARLHREYPLEFEQARATPRLIPNLFAFREALATDRFSLKRAYENRAMRSLWAPILLPLVIEILIALRARFGG
jgi:protein-S-isoprenylcysteine O-methyltransferase Ste14